MCHSRRQQLVPSAPPRGDADPGALQRLINRVLLNINLPSATLTDESPVFRWR